MTIIHLKNVIFTAVKIAIYLGVLMYRLSKSTVDSNAISMATCPLAFHWYISFARPLGFEFQSSSVKYIHALGGLSEKLRRHRFYSFTRCACFRLL